MHLNYRARSVSGSNHHCRCSACPCCATSLALIILVPAGLQAQIQSADHRATAARVESQSLNVDGHLDEAVRAQATPATGFILREPPEGVPKPEITEVRFL